MRQAKVYYRKDLAGILTETDDGEYIFEYDKVYAKNHPNDFISFTMPIVISNFSVEDRPIKYSSRKLFPFFEGLLPEGWLLDIAVERWKVKPDDKMGLLLTCCKDCVGAVSIYPMDEDMT